MIRYRIAIQGRCHWKASFVAQVTSDWTEAEIRQGIERLRTRNSRRAQALEKWLEELVQSFRERLLPVDEKVAQNWGRMNARSSFPVIDSLLAATAETYGLILVTRNLKDIEPCGVRCLNPFAG